MDRVVVQQVSLYSLNPARVHDLQVGASSEGPLRNLPLLKEVLDDMAPDEPGCPNEEVQLGPPTCLAAKVFVRMLLSILGLSFEVSSHQPQLHVFLELGKVPCQHFQSFARNL